MAYTVSAGGREQTYRENADKEEPNMEKKEMLPEEELEQAAGGDGWKPGASAGALEVIIIPFVFILKD